MRNLVGAHRYLAGAINQDIGTLQQRIAQKPVGLQISITQFFLLILVTGDTLQPAQRGHHGQQQMQLGMFRDPRLDKDRGGAGIDTGRKPVNDHTEGVVSDDLRRGVMRC